MRVLTLSDRAPPKPRPPVREIDALERAVQPGAGLALIRRGSGRLRTTQSERGRLADGRTAGSPGRRDQHYRSEDRGCLLSRDLCSKRRRRGPWRRASCRAMTVRRSRW
jgi:hypothetical protein